MKREDQVINRMLQEVPPDTGQRRLLLGLWFALGFALGALGKWVHDKQIYAAGSDFGYYLGLVGGLLMLSLLLYPLRKRQVLFGERCGRMQHWFRFHVCAGICGPLLVLFHSTFRTGSLNAAAALYAMLLVVVSGIIGRFIYRHVSAGLHGRRLQLSELTQELDATDQEMGAVYLQCPACEQQLEDFRAHALTCETSLAARAWKFATLRLQGKRLARRLSAETRQTLQKQQTDTGITPSVALLSRQMTQFRIERHIRLVIAVSQLARWERLFSLWHVVHVPFLYLLAFSGIVHVIAVHMY